MSGPETINIKRDDLERLIAVWVENNVREANDGEARGVVQSIMCHLWGNLAMIDMHRQLKGDQQ